MPARTSRKSKAAPDRDAMLDAALGLIARDGWPAFSLAALADHLGIGKTAILKDVGDRFDVLVAVGRRATAAAMTDAAAAGGSESIRDRLFEILMARFDNLQDHRAAIQTLEAASRRDPALAALFAARLPREMATVAMAAGVPTRGMTGALRIAGLTGLYLRVARVWLKDDSLDMSKTMAELDKRLAQIEPWAARLARLPDCGTRRKTMTANEVTSD